MPKNDFKDLYKVYVSDDVVVLRGLGMPEWAHYHWHRDSVCCRFCSAALVSKQLSARLDDLDIEQMFGITFFENLVLQC